MSTCNYRLVKTDGYSDVYSTDCGKTVRYEAPIEVGISFAPSPTDGGSKFCTYCGGKIKAHKTIVKEAWTFDEWKSRGYGVKKGQKATGRNAAGKATFTIDQVTETYNEPNDWEYDDDDYWRLLYNLGDW